MTELIPQEILKGLDRIYAMCPVSETRFERTVHTEDLEWVVVVKVSPHKSQDTQNGTAVVPIGSNKGRLKGFDIGDMPYNALMFLLCLRVFRLYIGELYRVSSDIQVSKFGWVTFKEWLSEHQLTGLLDEGSLLHPLAQWAKEIEEVTNASS